MKEIMEFLKKNKFGNLATCNGNKPDTRPFEVAHIANEGLLFYVSADTELSKQLKENPNICFCATDEKYNYVKITGEISFSNKQEDKDKVLENSHFAKKVFESCGTEKMEVFYLSHGQGMLHHHIDDNIIKESF
ncbi:pyridoxamine 5'-phosphate oxidase [Anaerotignum neopropionicum]|uniref:Pyridoxamine 5'-phosphate oxidase n=1 Tax=Anaerotignum neopropionicum TaxID=36847 RepID=A0A136WEL4_9FIRM|nr:pyridoxamine 5'-phosphate oxidase family protein [Anaerotignum neopropionicum]KXL52968.1 pyridoxamine 5'-phosphate oxidase [Anaerotignum neopropionicum]